MDIAQINELCGKTIPTLDNYTLMRVISTALVTVSERIVGDEAEHTEMFNREIQNLTDDSLIEPTELVRMAVACWHYANNR